MSKFIVGTDKVTQALVDSGAITDDLREVRRIVIDLPARGVGMIYIEKFADDEKLSVALGAGIEVTTE